jgi:glycosyltransferase involved in cell wall biosynthesis
MTKVALVHDWLTGMRGGEYVLEAISELVPQSGIFTLVAAPDRLSPALSRLPIHTSYLQKFPGATERYRHLLPLMPSAIESFDLSRFELIISSSHCVAKGVRKAPGAVHVSYVHAPMRYMWDRFDEYFGPGKASLPVRAAATALRSRLQDWDRRVSQPDRVDALVANSEFIAAQVRAAYGREAQVVYPFAELGRFNRPRRPGPDYLMVGAFAPYKRVDLAIEVFNRLRLPLKIVGGGQEQERLRLVAGSTIEFLGALSNEEIAERYSSCRAFIFPGKEDFGITPLEAMASGAPVIAFREGGAAETVTERTGVFFTAQTIDALLNAVNAIESGAAAIQEADCRARAAEFSRERFQRELASAIKTAWLAAGKSAHDLPEPLASRARSEVSG